MKVKLAISLVINQFLIRTTNKFTERMKSMKKIISRALGLILSVCVASGMFVVYGYSQPPNIGNPGYWNAERTNLTLNAFTSNNPQNFTNVTTWPIDYSYSQRWCVRRASTGDYYIESELPGSIRYALDCYTGSSNLNNCDLYNIALSNNTLNPDAFVLFIKEASGMYAYGIKLKTKALYLTEDSTKPVYYGSTQGYDVRWNPATGDPTPNAQVWHFDNIDMG